MSHQNLWVDKGSVTYPIQNTNVVPNQHDRPRRHPNNGVDSPSHWAVEKDDKQRSWYRVE
jgi:hypothetical protein